MSNQKKSFESAMDELEKLISEIENNTLPLEKLIDHISHGAELIKLCQDKLNAMNGKVEILLKDSNSTGEFTSFDPETTRSKAAGTVPQATISAAGSARKQTASANDTQSELPL